MKTYLLCVVFLIVSVTGSAQKKPQPKTKPKSGYITKVLDKREAFDYNLPEGTKAAFLKKRDTKTFTDILIVIPLSGNKNFDSGLHKIIEDKKKDFLEGSYKNDMPNDFEVTPMTVYKSGRIISYKFVIASGSADAAHGSAEFFSYNYDLQKNRPITFEDYFTVDTDQDEQFFYDLINKKIEADSVGIGSRIKEVDFSIEKDSISFNLGYIGAYMQGMYQPKISKAALREKINKSYRSEAALNEKKAFKMK